ncbi:hypothetical protein QJS66_08345 [Kocuria rhizophila]|nr:hypothetical protein QJS66_08345 [Kocuria rhizophila]
MQLRVWGSPTGGPARRPPGGATTLRHPGGRRRRPTWLSAPVRRGRAAV